MLTFSIKFDLHLFICFLDEVIDRKIKQVAKDLTFIHAHLSTYSFNYRKVRVQSK